MPYITPFSIPAAIKRRCLLIPDEQLWLAAVSGALLDLTYARNWEDIDGITADEAATRAKQILSDYYSETCSMIGQLATFVSLAAVPSNFLLMDGRTRTQAAYPDLFDVVPSSWKSGTDFTLPSMINRSAIGSDTDNPSTPPVQGTTGGEVSHTLTVGEMPIHHHPPQAGFGSFIGFKSEGPTLAVPAGAVHAGANNTGDTGGGDDHNNMPPYLVVVWAVWALP